MDFTLVPARVTPLVRRLLWADALIEAVIALVLAGLIGRAHWWLNVDRTVTLAGAALFAIAALVIAFAARDRRTSPEFVQYLGFANVAGGLALWVGAILRWDHFEDEGHWLIAAGADAFILIGILQLVALRKTLIA
jgi:hypothetical protein